MVVVWADLVWGWLSFPIRRGQYTKIQIARIHTHTQGGKDIHTYMPCAVPLRQHAIHPGGDDDARHGIEEQGAEGVVAACARSDCQLQGLAQVQDVGGVHRVHRACFGFDGKERG